MIADGRLSHFLGGNIFSRAEHIATMGSQNAVQERSVGSRFMHRAAFAGFFSFDKGKSNLAP